jgi:large subunit ribosomal protein L25
MESPRLAAKSRDTLGKQVKNVRAAGQTPVVVYGHGTDAKSLAVDTKSFTRMVLDAGSSTLIDLAIDEAKPVKVLIQDSQYDPQTGTILHADLFQVKLDEKLQTEIPLVFVGESAAVADLDGNMVTTKDAVRVEAFPQDLISEIEVDISSIATFDDKITVGDLKVPSTIEILDDLEETLVVVTPPRSEEELEAELAPTTEEAEAAAVAATEEASTEKPEGEETSGEEEKSE